MEQQILFCIKWCYEELAELVEWEIDVRQGCSLSQCLFNVFVDNIISIFNEENTHASLVGDLMVLALLLLIT